MGHDSKTKPCLRIYKKKKKKKKKKIKIFKNNQKKF